MSFAVETSLQQRFCITGRAKRCAILARRGYCVYPRAARFKLEELGGDTSVILVQEKKKSGSLIVTHKLKKTEQISRIELDIVRKGEIPALVPVQISSSFFARKMYFVIRDVVSIPAYFRKGVPFGEFAVLIQKVIGTMMSCEAYGIRVNNLDLRPKYLFYQRERQQIKMLYWPLISVSDGADVRKMFWALGNCYVCAREDQSFKDRYMAYFAGRGKFDLFEFERMVRELSTLWFRQRAAREKVAAAAQGQKRPSPDTLFVAGISKNCPVLLHVDTNTKIELKHFPFSIGRSKKECDFELKGNYSASRKHLILCKSGGRIYAVDNRSLNGTVIEGKPLSAGAAVELKSGDTIVIGRDRLIFFAASGE